MSNFLALAFSGFLFFTVRFTHSGTTDVMLRLLQIAVIIITA
jgi:hypothetical protein